ncbi:hypothetical protein N7510_004476 [Penicillium lagena]|uniref:uncharacterized protein n=1 Tax=Penicillium lagena TaxID=94218 RepID=UPI00254059CD|nr:uncharacterized protein N7510_004476 [Penicillium lagena]KAJ5620492.1 hypothetical protein N7510_004476 [Penicillium lagena]
MSSESRKATGASGKSKRRYTDVDEDSRQNLPDENAAHPKRQRVSRACDSCRSKKDKCDGAQPVCSTCATLCRPCTYKANPKKRGLPTGYIRSLELLWGLAFQNIRGSEDVMRALMRSINMPSHLATMGKEAESSDTLMASFKNSTVLRDIERVLVVLELPEEEKQRSLQAWGEGDTPLDIDSILASSEAQEWQMPEGLDIRETPLPAGVSPSHRSAIKHTTSRPSRDCGTQTPSNDGPSGEAYSAFAIPHTPGQSPTKSSLQLPYNAWPLLDIYFSYTQCWFPILEKHDILRTAFQYTEGDVYISRSVPGSGDHAALWAVLTLASLQDTSITATRPLDDRPSVDPSRLYSTSRDLIPPEDGPHEVGHVQALLILSLIKFGQQEWTAAWMLVGQAVRIAHTLGLDRPSFSAEQDKQSGRGKHVFLGCFVLETLIAEQTSQCPSLRKADLARVGSINEDGLEEWHPWEDQTGLRPTQSARASLQRGPLHALSTFNRLVSLVSILNELCCYRQDPTVSRSQLESLDLQLQRWVASLPKSYRVDLQSRPIRLASPHIFGLEMIYESIVTTLSLQIASREYNQNLLDMPHRMRAMQSSSRLLQLLNVYMETYSISATTPTLGMILRYGLPHASSRDSPWNLDLGLQNKLQTSSSHLSLLWSPPDRHGGGHGPQYAGPSPTASQHLSATASEDPNLQGDLRRTATSQHLPPPSEGRASRSNANAAVDPFLSSPWLRATQPSLLPTPTSSLTTVGGPDIPPQPGHLDSALGSGLRPSVSGPSKSPPAPGILPELSPSFHATGQYPPTYHDPSLGLGSFVDMDAYGPSQRQRIAPDLDALFDELASLDGAEKADNQPEFMQNLGFVSDSGIPELYSFSGQIEPFLLAQTQQLPSNGPSHAVRRESQPLSISAAPER